MTDMFSPGGTLRAAREKLKLTQADIAEATRIKVHMLEAIENNDFSRIAAPLYGKGFIKLYAERVGLDPAPLIRDYLIRHAQAVRPTLNADGVQPEAGPARIAAPRERLNPVRPKVSTGDLLAKGREAALRVAHDVNVSVRQAVDTIVSAWAARRGGTGRGVMRDPRLAREYGRSAEFPVGRYAAVGMAVVVVALLLGFGIHLLKRSSTPERQVPVSVAVPEVAKPDVAAPAPRLRLAEEPPAPYLKPRKR